MEEEISMTEQLSFMDMLAPWPHHLHVFPEDITKHFAACDCGWIGTASRHRSPRSPSTGTTSNDRCETQPLQTQSTEGVDRHPAGRALPPSYGVTVNAVKPRRCGNTSAGAGRNFTTVGHAGKVDRTPSTT